MLLLKDFFCNMEDYVIMKMDNNFPNFEIKKDDVDILCIDMDKTINHIINILNDKYKSLLYKIKIINDGIKQVDIYDNNQFIFKFDLLNNLKAKYSNYNIPKEITYNVIKNGIIVKKYFKIPMLKDELMIRQLEYESYINVRPDKIKHLNFIKKHNDIKYTKFSKI